MSDLHRKVIGSFIALHCATFDLSHQKLYKLCDGLKINAQDYVFFLPHFHCFEMLGWLTKSVSFALL